MAIFIQEDDQVEFIDDLSSGQYVEYTIPNLPAGATAAMVVFLTTTTFGTKQADARAIGDTTTILHAGTDNVLAGAVDRTTRVAKIIGGKIEVRVNTNIASAKICAFFTDNDFAATTPRRSIYDFGSWSSSAALFNFSSIAPSDATAVLLTFNQVSGNNHRAYFRRDGESALGTVEVREYSNTNIVAVPLINGRVNIWFNAAGSASSNVVNITGFLRSTYHPVPLNTYQVIGGIASGQWATKTISTPGIDAAAVFLLSVGEPNFIMGIAQASGQDETGTRHRYWEQVQGYAVALNAQNELRVRAPDMSAAGLLVAMGAWEKDDAPPDPPSWNTISDQTISHSVTPTTRDLKQYLVGEGSITQGPTWGGNFSVSTAGILTIPAGAGNRARLSVTATNESGASTSNVFLQAVTPYWSIDDVSYQMSTDSLPQTRDLKTNVTATDQPYGWTIQSQTPDTGGRMTVSGSGVMTVAAGIGVGSYEIRVRFWSEGQQLTSAPFALVITAGTLQPPSLELPGSVRVIEGASGSINLNEYNVGGASTDWSATGTPPWMTVSAAGILNYTNAQAGSGTITVTATNGSGQDSANVNYTVDAALQKPSISIPDLSLTQGDTGSRNLNQYNSGGQADRWNGSGLPAWAGLATNGNFTWTNAQAGSGAFTITASNAAGDDSDSVNYTVASTVAPPDLNIPALRFQQNGSGNVNLNQYNTGGAAPTWESSGRPDWMNVSTAGLLTYASAQPPDGSFSVTARNSSGSDSQTATYVIEASEQIPDIRFPPVFYLNTGQSGSQNLNQYNTGGASSDWWAESPPSWVTVSTSGNLQYSSARYGNGAFWVNARNSGGTSRTQLNYSVIDAGDSVTVLTSTEPFNIAEGAEHSITIRHSKGGLSEAKIIAQIDPYSVKLDRLIPIAELGDLISWGITSFVTRPFLVKGIAPTGDLGASLALMPYAEQVYSADAGEMIPPYDPGLSPDLTNPLQTTFTISQTFFYIARAPYTTVSVTWNEVANTAGYEVWLWTEIEPAYKKMAQVTGTTFVLFDRVEVDPDAVLFNKEVRVKVVQVNIWGKRYPLINTPHQSLVLRGHEGLPLDIPYLNLDVRLSEVFLEWIAPNMPNIEGYYLKYSPLVTGATWESSATLVRSIPHSATSISVPARIGSYLLKVIDTTGAMSVSPAIASTTIPAIGGNEFYGMSEPAPGWAGTLTGTVKDGATLVLAKDGDGNYVPEGTFIYSDTVDLGKILQVRVENKIQVYGSIASEMISTWARLSDITTIGSIIKANDFDCLVEMQVADGAGAFGPWISLMAGDYTAQRMRFRLRLLSYKEDVTPRVTAGLIELYLLRRVESAYDAVCPAAGLDVFYERPFERRPAIAISANLQTATTTYVITDQRADGFHIAFKDGAASVERVFDWVAAGRGTEEQVIGGYTVGPSNMQTMTLTRSISRRVH